MKCPCCKYENTKRKYIYVPTERVIKSGKNKGKIVVEDVYTCIGGVGDEEFERVRFMSIRDGNPETDSFSCCPKCGVCFKEKP